MSQCDRLPGSREVGGAHQRYPWRYLETARATHHNQPWRMTGTRLLAHLLNRGNLPLGDIDQFFRLVRRRPVCAHHRLRAPDCLGNLIRAGEVPLHQRQPGILGQLLRGLGQISRHGDHVMPSPQQLCHNARPGPSRGAIQHNLHRILPVYVVRWRRSLRGSII